MRRLLLLLASLVVSSQACAQPVARIVVPFAAGGVQDVLARIVAPDLATLLGRTVIVENRAGAGGTIGTASVAKSAPDGNTLILAAASHTIAGTLYGKLPYHPLNDFTPVAHIGTVDYVVMISSQVPAATVADFISFAKKNPGKLNYSSAGNGSATHLGAAYFVSLAGLDMVHVPFKATGEAVQEVLAGRAQLVVAATIGAIPFVKDSRVHVLGVTGAHRSKFLPELPVIGDSLPGYVFDSWMGLLGPAGMPKATVAEINAAMNKLLRDPAMLEKLAKQGVDPQAMSPEEFGALLRRDFDKMAKVVKASGARID